MSAADLSDKCRAFAVANTTRNSPTHWFRTLEDQMKGHAGTSCMLHKGSGVCNPCPQVPDLGMIGSPCHPFSTQRSDRFSAGSVQAHAECKVAMCDMVDWLCCFEPRIAILEQVMGFDMPEYKGASMDTSPKKRHHV